MDLEYCELTGKIDLVIKEEDISIVKFIPSFKDIINIDQYLNNLNFYGLLIKNHDDYKEMKVKNIILHSIKENKQYTINFDESFKKDLDIIVENIFNEDFDVNEENCDCCEFKEIICKY